jgi:membrane protein DedA with SNARE-associated domain
VFETIVNTVAQSGYVGIFLLMFAENLFPPIPSELIMPLAGFVAARGELSLPLVVIAGTLGSIVGALPWYYAGALLGQERLRRLADRHGRWLTMSAGDIDRASLWFQHHGASAVFFGRLIPAIRTLISVPAGITRMPLAPFLFYSTIGSLIWTSLLAAAGFMLEKQYVLVADYVDPVSKLIVIAVVAIYFYRLLRYTPQKSR